MGSITGEISSRVIALISPKDLELSQHTERVEVLKSPCTVKERGKAADGA